VSKMSTAANCKTPLDAIMISRCQGYDTLVAFQPIWVFSVSGETGSFASAVKCSFLSFSKVLGR